MSENDIDLEDTEYSDSICNIHEDGANALAAGLSDDSNPYPRHTSKHDWWLAGWLSAETNRSMQNSVPLTLPSDESR